MKKFIKTCLGIGAVLASSLLPSLASADFINGSFEDNVVPPNSYTAFSGSDLTGWTYTSGGFGALIPNGFDGAGSYTTWHDTPAGNQYLYIAQSVTPGITLDQALTLSLGSHTLSFLQADFASSFQTPGGAVDVTIYNPDSSVLVGPTLFTTTTYSDFIQQSLTFTTPTEGSYDVQFTTIGGQAGIIDNVRMDAVPEPAPIAALGLGALGLLLRRRRN